MCLENASQGHTCHKTHTQHMHFQPLPRGYHTKTLYRRVVHLTLHRLLSRLGRYGWSEVHFLCDHILVKKKSFDLLSEGPV